MRQPRFKSNIGVFAFALFGACLLLSAAWAHATEPNAVTKVLISDSTFREIANTGTLNAVNRIFGNEQIPNGAKTHAISAVLTGASHAGMLVATTLVEGDQFFAIDGQSGEVVAVSYQSSEFVIPSGTGFTVMSIPPG